MIRVLTSSGLALLAGCSPAPEGWLVQLHGVVLDAQGDGVAQAEVALGNPDLGVDVASVETNDQGVWSVPIFVSESEIEETWPLKIEATADGYPAGVSHWEMSWRDLRWPASPHSLGPGQQVDLGSLRTPGIVLFEDTGPVTVTATVQSALDGGGLGEMSVEIRAGWNAPETEPVLAQAISGPGGQVSLELPAPGIYTLHAESGGDFERSVAGLWGGPNGPDVQRVLMSPRLVGDSMRAALVWRDADRDLDLHLSGPLAGEAGRYQVYVSDTPHPIYGEPIAEVEWVGDNWETVGVYTVRSGDYRFSAHDREFGWESGSLALAAQRPTLVLWTGDGPTMESLAPGATGTIWQALEVSADEGRVYRLQGMSEGMNEWDVSAF